MALGTRARRTRDRGPPLYRASGSAAPRTRWSHSSFNPSPTIQAQSLGSRFFFLPSHRSTRTTTRNFQTLAVVARAHIHGTPRPPGRPPLAPARLQRSPNRLCRPRSPQKPRSPRGPYQPAPSRSSGLATIPQRRPCRRRHARALLSMQAAARAHASRCVHFRIIFARATTIS